MKTTNAKLIAIVGVEPDARVQCQQPGCGHSVYRRIHVVQEEAIFLVLGSTCFDKRYGSALALGKATYGSGGEDGRRLTDAQRLQLIHNTAALIAEFERETREAQELPRAKLAAFRATASAPKVVARQAQSMTSNWNKSDTPWAWSKPLSSIAYFSLNDGTHWVRTQHVEGFHVLMPWPSFDGWDELFPASVGTPDQVLGGYRISQVAQAIAYVRARGNFGHVGAWREVMGGRPKFG